VLVDGQYLCSILGASVGIFEGDGGVPSVEQTSYEEAVNNTDAYGKSRIDGIYQGGDSSFAGTLMEYKAAGIAAMWPYGAPGVMGIIGRLRYALAGALVLTAISGTPAASSPATLTATYAILAANFPIKLLFGPTLRKIPLKMDLLPYAGGSGVIWHS
jgi:hypothetical protein